MNYNKEMLLSFDDAQFVNSLCGKEKFGQSDTKRISQLYDKYIAKWESPFSMEIYRMETTNKSFKTKVGVSKAKWLVLYWLYQEQKNLGRSDEDMVKHFYNSLLNRDAYRAVIHTFYRV